MKREILGLICAAAGLGLAGCATNDYSRGGARGDTGIVYGTERDRESLRGPVAPEWDDHAPGNYRH